MGEPELRDQLLALYYRWSKIAKAQRGIDAQATSGANLQLLLDELHDILETLE